MLRADLDICVIPLQKPEGNIDGSENNSCVIVRYPRQYFVRWLFLIHINHFVKTLSADVVTICSTAASTTTSITISVTSSAAASTATSTTISNTSSTTVPAVVARTLCFTFVATSFSDQAALTWSVTGRMPHPQDSLASDY